jgi:hypothetical protein
MPYPITTSAYGIWSLNQVRSAELGNTWPTVGGAATSHVNNASGVSVASNVWSLRDAYKAEAGGDWPEIYVPPTYYTHPTYGTLVATFVSPDWQPIAVISVTEGIPQPSDSTNVILSNSAFQSVRAATTANLVYYVWGTSLENYVSFYRSQIETAKNVTAPTTTINPNSFGNGAGNSYRVHWWSETTGFDGIGADYSFMTYRDTNTLNLYNFGPVKDVSRSNTGFLNSIITTAKFHIFYK